MLVFRDRLLANIDAMIAIAGDPSRLRPHCKTHKTREVVKLQIERGILKHKCATFAEAEMLAEAGCGTSAWPTTWSARTSIAPSPFAAPTPTSPSQPPPTTPTRSGNPGNAMAAAGQQIAVLLDIDTGQHRTGVGVGDEAGALYRLISDTDGLAPGGFHVYDGHQHQEDRGERREAVDAEFNRVVAFRDGLVADGLAVPRMVAGARRRFPDLRREVGSDDRTQPGHLRLQRRRIRHYFPDMDFPPAAAVLTRVVSRPTSDRITLDLGTRPSPATPPWENASLPRPARRRTGVQNEEHLVCRPTAPGLSPGDILVGIPWHVCPTSALHGRSSSSRGNWSIAGTWPAATGGSHLR
ncbi:MAG: threonine aldolase [Planctomycetaceae bacterium]|nr:MAG: threonine aldolase [Planctomycetaceae bacterium]